MTVESNNNNDSNDDDNNNNNNNNNNNDPSEVENRIENTSSLSILENTPPSKLKMIFVKCWKILLLLPLVLGVGWTCCHPIVSILTGESKCRGWYIDEHALEIHFAQYNTNKEYYNTNHVYITNKNQKNTFCDNIFADTTLSCWDYDSYQVSMIVPLQGAITPIHESIVLIVNNYHYTKKNDNNNNNAALVQQMVHQLIDRLIHHAPWLAKTVIVVIPKTKKLKKANSKSLSLENTVQQFLNDFQMTTTSVTNDGPYYASTMIRNLIVLDIQENSNNDNNFIQVLPQGRRGLLPNMDFVFVITKLLLEKTNTIRKTTSNNYNHNNNLFMHAHPQWSLQTKQWITDTITTISNQSLQEPYRTRLQLWLHELIDMVAFIYTSSHGPFPPSAPALDHGIDAITIRVQTNNNDSHLVMLLFQSLDFLIRALSNLHERLHHSITLYWLPSPSKFVSHLEYLLPMILLLLPLIIRCMQIVFLHENNILLKQIGVTTRHQGRHQQQQQQQQYTMELVSIVFLLWLFLLTCSTTTNNYDNGLQPIGNNNNNLSIPNTIVLGLYCITILIIQRLRPYCSVAALQFVACLCAIYIHVPIAFAHGSLAYPSCLFWTSILALPTFESFTKKWQVLLLGMIVLMTWPPIYLVPTIFSSHYTPFVTCAFLPLHLQLFAITIRAWMGT